jgi:hypothetical protein
MVALKSDEPLLLYIVATTEVMSMVQVVERMEPKQSQALKGAPAIGSGSQDLDPTEGPRDQEAPGSQLSEPTLSPAPQIGSRLSDVLTGPEDQEASGSQISEPMEASATTMLHPARWSVKPFNMAFTSLQPFRMPLSW